MPHANKRTMKTVAHDGASNTSFRSKLLSELENVETMVGLRGMGGYVAGGAGLALGVYAVKKYGRSGMYAVALAGGLLVAKAGVFN